MQINYKTSYNYIHNINKTITYKYINNKYDNSELIIKYKYFYIGNILYNFIIKYEDIFSYILYIHNIKQIKSIIY